MAHGEHAVVLAVVIARLPFAPVRDELHRRIEDRLARHISLLDRGGIYERLECTSRLARSKRRAIEARMTDVAAADQRDDVTCVDLLYDDRTLQILRTFRHPLVVTAIALFAVE